MSMSVWFRTILSWLDGGERRAAFSDGEDRWVRFIKCVTSVVSFIVVASFVVVVVASVVVCPLCFAGVFCVCVCGACVVRAHTLVFVCVFLVIFSLLIYHYLLLCCLLLLSSEC